MIHGDKDTLAPVADARAFVEGSEPRRAERSLYLELRGAQHAFDVFTSIRTRRVVTAVERFLGASGAGGSPRARPDPTDA